MPTLKDAFRGQFEIGAALGGLLPDDFSPAEISLILQQFNNVTSENCLKPKSLQPHEGQWDWCQADALVTFAQAHQLHLTGHCLVWHSQCPQWLFEDGAAPAPRGLVLQRTRNHLQQILNRYRGKIQSWDVVNEALGDGPLYIRESFWKACVGEDYVAKAFEFAHQIDPQMRLNYNDYDIELPKKRAKALHLLKDLLSRGLRVDAVGIQGHWILDKVPFEHIEAAIEEFAALGLDVMITELDLDVVDREVSGASISAADQSTSDPFIHGCTPEVLHRQADQYARLFRIFKKHQDKLTRVTFWGIHDGKSWLNSWPRKRTNHALLFDRQSHPKPAFHAVMTAAVAP
jgi:endo-1,4-beta-xylanase